MTSLHVYYVFNNYCLCFVKLCGGMKCLVTLGFMNLAIHIFQVVCEYVMDNA